VTDEVQAALETIFAADTGIYQPRGFQRRVGFGRRPALIHIDLANAWTRPGHAFSCDGMDVIIPAVQALNEANRLHHHRLRRHPRAEQRHGPLAPQDPR
jgi:N-carbamoylsarcosine amidase